MIGRPAEPGDLYLIPSERDTLGECRFLFVKFFMIIDQVYYGKIGVNICEIVVCFFLPFLKVCTCFKTNTRCECIFLTSVNELMFWYRMHVFTRMNLSKSRDLRNHWKCKTALTLPKRLNSLS